jgi:sporulation protein YlmC with PRC-barrel domain
MDLVHDLLDKRVVDRNGLDMGRVDTIVLEIRDGASPRVAAIEIGPAVLARRIHPVLGRWVAALEHGFGVDEGRPVRIPFSAILDIQDDVRVDLVFGETGAATVERRLRRWVGSLPLSS